jgi:hypothetical protein
MQLTDVSVETDKNSLRLIGHAQMSQSKQKFDIYFQYPIKYLDWVSNAADAFAVAMLVPSMKAGESLVIGPAISSQLYFNLPRVRDIFHAWYPDCQRIEIEATTRAEAPRPKERRGASFFSGGVDSFYTLLKCRRDQCLPGPLTHIIFMRGVETPLERSEGVERSQALAEEVAAHVGAQCIVGETNIRSQFPLHWETYYFGSGLSATALGLSGGLGYACIPSSLSYKHLKPHGSTPFDELFSTESLQIIHDGAEAMRPEKLEQIVRWERDLVLSHLRVCIMNSGGDYNCGKCYKCVRTAVALKILRAWEEAKMFVERSTTHWERVMANDHLGFTEENAEFARAQSADPEMIELLDKVIRRRRSRAGVRAFVENTALRPLLPHILSLKKHLP